ncbi:MAG: ribose 5-phosphate isomerase B [Acidobacteria bacterium]|nr:ribose 5-phosphate isomerase B [Acidobacteriota bacterium]
MPRPVLTASDLDSVPDGGEIRILRGAVVTPLALEEAARRRITIQFQEPVPDSAPPSTQTSGRVIAIGADHGGFELKQQIVGFLQAWGFTVLDQGTNSSAAVDYPDFAEAVANCVVRGDAALGIVVDTVGIGSSIAANKVPGARAALCYDRSSARNSREHNDANILSLGARSMPAEVAREIVAVWLETPFAGGRHQKRVDKIGAIERRHLK